MSGIDGIGRPRPGISDLAGTTQSPTTAEKTGKKTGMGALAHGPGGILPGAAMFALASPTGGLPEPVKAAAAVGTVGLAAAEAALGDSGTFSMLEVTHLVFKANKQTRQIHRNDMASSLEAQAELTQKVADNMRSAASARFTAAVVSSVVSAVGSVMSLKTAVASPAASEAYGRGFGAVSGLISATGELKASGLESDNKLLEAAIGRQEKTYQEAASLLGDARENLQVARDTIRALAESSAMGRIAGNF